MGITNFSLVSIDYSSSRENICHKRGVYMSFSQRKPTELHQYKFQVI